MTEDEAKRWLALFGSAPRPPSKLVSNEIQSLVFGGLIFMPQGTCLLFDLPADRGCARQWLSDVCPHIAFNDGRRLRESAVVTLALGSEGLARLGLPAESLETFPFAFLQGMTGEGRARILGDIGENGSEFWRWGRTQPHVALVVYVRYVDDFALFHDDPAESSRWRSRIERYLVGRRLKLHPRKTMILSCGEARALTGSRPLFSTSSAVSPVGR